MAALAAPYFDEEIELIETHHAGKKDAPSGTALMLANTLKNVKIQSIRSGEVVGEHQLIFRSKEERLTIGHEALTRAAFARGALAAARFLHNKPPGLYGMDDLVEKLNAKTL